MTDTNPKPLDRDAEIARLRAALEPFAVIGRQLKMRPESPMWVDEDDGLTGGHFMEAARAFDKA